MPFGVNGPFALVDAEPGGVRLLSGYRGEIAFDGDVDPPGGLAAAFAAIEAAAARGEWVMLAADYGLGARFDPAVAAGERGQRLRAWRFGQADFLDDEALRRRAGAWRSGLPEHERVAGIADWRPGLDEHDYMQRVEQVHRWIRAGDLYQINLTFPIDFRVFGHPFALYLGLRQRQPARYGAYVEVPGATILSRSPELFFERRGSRVTARPMKGTAPRGATPAEDRAAREALLSSAKERAENVMIVDLLRNDLGRLASPGSVRVDALCVAEAYPTLWQQVSTVSGELPGATLHDLFAALFPCGSITGAPKIRACQRIAALETTPRALYTGALGWLAPDGDCRFNVAIRTFEFGAGGAARLGVGSGIVADSEPRREYAECLLKAQFLSGFDPGFALIETLRLEHGGYPMLPLHLDRLRASAMTLGFALDEAGVRVALAEHAAARPSGVFRVRLCLAHDGRFDLTVQGLVEERSAWRAVLASECLPDGDFLRGHKTTARRRYDDILASLPPDVFDAVFFNAAGEVCEGARSNVFVERDGYLLTPPLACGLLPGVLRGQLLESGRALERVLKRDDLLCGDQVYLGNALRGLVAVTVEATPTGG